MTQSELNEIVARLKAAKPKYAASRITMTWTQETILREATIWYDDGDQCATIYGNLGLDIDGDAVAEFFAHSISDVSALLDEVKKLKTIKAEIEKTR